MRNPLYLFLTLTCLFLAQISWAQRAVEYSTKNKKAINAYEASENFLVRRQWEQVVQLLGDAIKRDPEFFEARIRLATAYRALGNLPQAVSELEAAANPKKGTPVPESLFALGELYWQLGRYGDANDKLGAFLATSPRQKPLVAAANQMVEGSRFALAQLENPQDFNPEPLPDQVNKFPLQFFPVLTVDERTLIFTGRKGADPRDLEDLYIVRKDDQGQWSEPESISDVINTEYNEGTATISADGRTLIFTSCQGRRSYGRCDLFISYKTGDTWSEPQNLGAGVNSKHWETQASLSADGRTLFFVSDRPGGKGGTDIWVSRTGDDGKWTDAENAGAEINSAGNEMSPFIHANGQTLYFSSNTHLGMGGYDLFVTEKQEGNGWNTARNLGYPINTHEDQFSLFVTADGSTGYYTQEKSLNGQPVSGKIYTFKLPETARVQNRSSFVTGRVYDSETKKPVGASVQLYNLDTHQMEQQVGADVKNGSYYMVLTEGASYALYVSQPGYLFKSLSFDFGKGGELKPVTLDVLLDPVRSGKITRLSNLFFETDKHEIQPKSETELRRVLNFLEQNPDVHIEIAGHTDDVGQAAYNQQLSLKRAQAVHGWLLKAGIAASRLRAKGYGQSQPQVPNTSQENRQQNRRIEFKIL